MDGKEGTVVHFQELHRFLGGHAVRDPETRARAREKLRRLDDQQLYELSTDVYDELMRRKTKSSTSHLASDEKFHPKRNQARQKLFLLEESRFKDLTSDIYYELGKRYPEFNKLEYSEPQVEAEPQHEAKRTRFWNFNVFGILKGNHKS